MDPDIAIRSIDDLRHQLRKVRDELADKVGALDLDELRYELRRDLRSAEERAEERMAVHEEALDALGRDLRDELERTTATMSRRLTWLERHVRASAGAITAQLDPDPELVELARRAERGRSLDEQLLDPIARSLEAGTVQEWESWQQQWHAQCLAALAASRRIADTEPEDGARQRSVPAFHSARRELARLAERRDDVQAAAERAEQKLARDDALRRAAVERPDRCGRGHAGADPHVQDRPGGRG